MLANNDPMIGFYDRIVQGDNEERKQLLKGITLFLCKGLHLSKQNFKQHCIEEGYGSEKTMNYLLE